MLKRVLCVLLLFPVLAFAEDFVAGKDYELVNGTAPSVHAGKVMVTEFFSYGCPWCYRIEPALNTWVQQQGNKVQFSRIPVVFHKEWEYYAKAYYTANLLGLESKLGPALFKAIQNDKRPLANNEEMIQFFTAEGVDNATAKSAFENSTTIDVQVAEGLATMSRYRINGVPAIVVNNQYKTDLQMAKNPERFLQILDFLVKKAQTA
ncbi:thiol:disulfide interchange protein DsbA/DsbL [Legionella jordanis]|uniref:Thiol:disulfide interchange protein n=1 Tax=Legionella jordanis TaxID=456 RepID=A0A0W0VCB2_9GAMM|nr:thiol:disulfide interchange protein DsbA/DsbL [Legionella jordanis]KTD17727.1 thiol:disulfide interchange protein precursor DsbA [Legionella jordanis]RMX01591.1 thiol:disulfide interchange protein DsbA/DsbL [Legionella jordanis]RMX21587.1 thiol:disulfide interchange protein DsbA/DsbL [Legionella jordanis]VEH11339.1 thiol:disulfide interchange protein precursor DsbA [Legionella jordanis]HAT8714499.1 thioredoxin domain-containing protein [Legionella jordanis]